MQSKYERILSYDPFSVPVNKASSYTLISLKKIEQMGRDHGLFKTSSAGKLKMVEVLGFGKIYGMGGQLCIQSLTCFTRFQG